MGAAAVLYGIFLYRTQIRSHDVDGRSTDMLRTICEHLVQPLQFAYVPALFGEKQIVGSGSQRIAQTKKCINGQTDDTALDDLMKLDTEFHFYFGGMGWFDQQCARAVYGAKKLHPEKEIQLMLVLPYRRKIENENLYDEILIPDEIKRLHYKAAIPMRNRWLVDRSHYLIAYVKNNTGGAAKTLQYAFESSLTVWNLID